MKKRNTIVVLLIFLLLFSGFVSGRQMYYDIFIDTYPQVKDTELDVCICHTNPFGGSDRNDYGRDFADSKYDLVKIETMDSDGDGWKNIDEINAGTHPGDPSSNPNEKDKTPPVIQILTPANGEVTSKPILLIEGTATDNDFVEKIILEIPGYDDRILHVINGTWKTKVMFETGATIEVKATAFDRAGNKATATVTVTIVFEDEIAPLIEFIFPQTGATLDSFPFIIKGRTIEKDNSTELVEYSLDLGETWKAARGKSEWQFPVTMAPEGLFEAWVRATDTAGNTSRPYKLKLNIKLKSILPPTITYPLKDLTIDKATMTISGIFQKPANSVEVKIDDADWKKTEVDGILWFTEVSGYSVGKHTISARAVDFYNRKSEITTLEFTYEARDSKPPVVAINSPKDGLEFEVGYYVVEGVAEDESGISRVQVKVDDAEWKPAVGRENWSHRMELETPGKHIVSVRATDTYGNTSEPVQIEIIILEPLKFVFGTPDEYLIKKGKLKVFVSWNRELETPPTIVMKGSTNKFQTENNGDKGITITASLGAGVTKLEVKGFHLRYVSETFSIKYQTTVKLTIGSDKMFVNENIFKIPEPALIVEGRLYIPFRSLGKAFGADVFWDNNTKTATYKLGDNSYSMTLNSLVAKVNGREVEMGNKPLIIRDRLMIPVRAVSEVMNAGVSYDSETRTATITLPSME